MRAIEVANKIKKIGTTIDMPWSVWTTFSDKPASIEVHANSFCLGSDYKTLDEVRDAIDWLANHFGGDVKWK